jgi:hypothetical protein
MDKEFIGRRLIMMNKIKPLQQAMFMYEYEAFEFGE